MPLAALVVLGWTFYKNAVGVTSPYSLFPIICLTWCAAGLAVLVLVPGLARKMHAGLLRADVKEEEQLPHNLIRRP